MIVEFYHSNLIFGIAFIMFGGAGLMIISWVAITLCVNCARPRANIDEERNISNAEQLRKHLMRLMFHFQFPQMFKVSTPSNKPVTSGHQDHPDQLSEIKNEQMESKCRAKSDGLSKDCSFEPFNQSQSLVPVNISKIESPEKEMDCAPYHKSATSEHHLAQSFGHQGRSEILPIDDQLHKIKNEQGENKCITKSNSGEGTNQVGQDKSHWFKSKEGVVNNSKNEEQREIKKRNAKGKKKRDKTHNEQLQEVDFGLRVNQEQGENTKVLRNKRKNEEEEKVSCKKKKEILDTFIPLKLENLGNTCYFNSALQALYQTRILGHLLIKLSHSAKAGHFSVEYYILGLSSFEKYVKFLLWFPNLQEILKNVRQSSNRFLGYKQEDSHELIRHLCQGLVKEEVKIHDSLTVVDKVFRGHVLRLYHCLKCHQVYHLVEQFYDLSLPISFPLEDLSDDNIKDDLSWMTKSKSPLVPLLTREIPARRGRPESDRESGRTKSVEVCLKYHTRRDTIPYFCQCFQGDPELDDLPIACDRSLLIDLPPVLIIHLQRFEQSQYGGFVKCGVPVIYPKVLDLAPYTIQYDESGKTENLYDLYGVVEHSGTIDFGHYIACIKTRKDTKERLKDFIESRNFKKDDVTQDWIINEMKKFGKSTNATTSTKEPQEKDSQWYYASDSQKEKIKEEEALSREAILLFYEKL